MSSCDGGDTKKNWLLILSLLSILAVTGLSLGLYFTFRAPPVSGVTITDDLGRAVYINGIPQRIVSHVPGITETIFALGLEDKVVGVSDYCDYPEEAKLKPSIGDYFNPSIEKIVELHPDLVLTDGHSQSITQLDSLGIKYMVLQPKDLDGIFRDIELLGKATGVERKAKKLVSDMQKDMSCVLARVKDAPRLRVLYIIDATDPNNPWTAGPGSLIDSLITMAGGENIAAEAQGAWAQFSLEAVVDSDPEIIILPAKHGTVFTPPEALREHPTWRETTAVKKDKIYVIDADLIDCPGPRIIQGLEEIARIVHPELFQGGM